MPRLYSGCGQAYTAKGDLMNAFEMYKEFLTQFPQHALAAEVEIALLANPVSCEKHESFQNTVIAEHFLPTLYYHCAQAYEKDKNYTSAIRMLEKFLAAYPKSCARLRCRSRVGSNTHRPGKSGWSRNPCAATEWEYE